MSKLKRPGKIPRKRKRRDLTRGLCQGHKARPRIVSQIGKIHFCSSDPAFSSGRNAIWFFFLSRDRAVNRTCPLSNVQSCPAVTCPESCSTGLIFHQVTRFSEKRFAKGSTPSNIHFPPRELPVNHPDDVRGDSVSEIKLRSTYNYSRAGCSLERKESRDYLPGSRE